MLHESLSGAGRPKVVTSPKKTKKPKADSGSDYDGEGDEDDKKTKVKKGKAAKGGNLSMLKLAF